MARVIDSATAGDVGFKVSVQGIPETRAALKQLERDIVNETRREMRQALRPLVADMRRNAPKRSGKLASTVKSFTTGRLSFGVRWGGKASAVARRRFLQQWGTPGRRGGSWLTSGRIDDAFYVHAVSKGHPLPRGGYIAGRKWAGFTVTRHVRRLHQEVKLRTAKVARKFNRTATVR